MTGCPSTADLVEKHLDHVIHSCCPPQAPLVGPVVKGYHLAAWLLPNPLANAYILQYHCGMRRLLWDWGRQSQSASFPRPVEPAGLTPSPPTAPHRSLASARGAGSRGGARGDSQQFYLPLLSLQGFPGDASSKEPAGQCRRRCKRCRFVPWVRKIPWKRAWQPTPVFLPGESQGQRRLVGSIELDTTEAT